MKHSGRSSLVLSKVILLSLLLTPAALTRQSVTRAGAAPVAGRAGAGATVADLGRLFQSPPDDSRIMMRWWWFGPSATREEVEAEMRRMKDGGIGGFELAVVYPMALDDPARGFRNYPYLSPEYLDLVRFAAGKARELGLRMDITVGSGWSYGGPYITPDLASARMKTSAADNVFTCVSYKDCKQNPVRWCEHSVGGYNGTTHGWPPAASPEIWNFVQGLK